MLRFIFFTLILSISIDPLLARQKIVDQVFTEAFYDGEDEYYEEGDEDDFFTQELLQQSSIKTQPKKQTQKPRSNKNTTKASPSVSELIKTLENDSQRKQLVTQLKTLAGVEAPTPPHLMFARAFGNVKAFIKSIESQGRMFVKSLIQKETWSIKTKPIFTKEVRNAQGFKLLYLVLVSLAIQIILAVTLKASLPPFFGKIRREFSRALLARTLISLAGFLCSAYLLKGFFVNGENMHTYGSEVIINVTLLQFGIVLMRTSISTGIFPVKPEHQGSLFGLFFMVLMIWIGQKYAADIVSFTDQTTTISHPIAQVFWGLVAILVILNLRKNRPVFEGMLFREIPFLGNASVLEMQKLVAGAIYHLITWGVMLIYLSWFIGYNTMFSYLETQIVLTLLLLFGISILSYFLVYSSGYLTETTKPSANLEAVTQRLINLLSFSGVAFIIYHWIIPIAEMQGFSTRKLSDKMFGIMVITVVTVLSVQGVSRIFNNALANAGRRNKHLKTFLPILDRVSKFVILFLAAFFLLIELGISPMPIFASFGVLGIGVGLASKTVIEDFINGLFIINENDLNIGEVVQISGTIGTVENITLRKVHLRDVKGYLNFIPFSRISEVVNLSRDFNKVRLDIPLPSKYHLKRTVGILEDVGQQLLNDPEIKDFIITPPKFVGVNDIAPAESSVDDITTFMQFEMTVKPTKGRAVSLEFRKLVKLAYEEIDKILG